MSAPIDGGIPGAGLGADALTLVHLSDLHFGVHCDLLQIEALEDFLPTLDAQAIVVSGDLSQRARHGEYQAAHAFLRRVRSVAPVLTVPGNHDVQWWASPFHLRGSRPLYRKYRAYFGEELTPVLRLPGLVIAGALSAHGLAWGSMTWNLRDATVKGHLPKSETDRVRKIFAAEPAGTAKVLVMHHNVLPGKLSQRQGLAHWRSAQRRLEQVGADVVLCGHDHQEGAGQLGGGLPISASGTHSSRMRGGRPSVFNLVRIDARAVQVQHYRWERSTNRFLPGDIEAFARARAAAGHPTVSVAGGDNPEL